MGKGNQITRYFYVYTLFSTEGDETGHEEIRKINEMIKAEFGKHRKFNVILKSDADRCLHAKDDNHAFRLFSRKVKEDATNFSRSIITIKR